MRRTKISIACEGGGSQTAFAAGALKTVLETDWLGLLLDRKASWRRATGA